MAKCVQYCKVCQNCHTCFTTNDEQALGCCAECISIIARDLQTSGIWKDIPGCPTHQVSTKGMVRSKDRTSTISTNNRNYTRKLKGHVLQSRPNNKGYLQTSINDKTMTVHRLVAETFLGDTYVDGYEVNHIDNVRDHNGVENLEWVTHSENELHKYRTTPCVPWNKGKRYTTHHVPWNKGKRYDTTNAVAVRNRNAIARFKKTYDMRESGMRAVEIAQKLNVTTRTVHEQIKQYKERRCYYE